MCYVVYIHTHVPAYKIINKLFDYWWNNLYSALKYYTISV